MSHKDNYQDASTNGCSNGAGSFDQQYIQCNVCIHGFSKWVPDATDIACILPVDILKKNIQKNFEGTKYMIKF